MDGIAIEVRVRMTNKFVQEVRIFQSFGAETKASLLEKGKFIKFPDDKYNEFIL